MTDRIRLRTISLRDFRNLADGEIRLPDAGLVLIGENGQGKTNFLEAAYYLNVLRSVRGARDADVARFDAAGFFVGGTVEGMRGPSTIGAGFEREGKRKRIRVDGVPVERLSEAVGLMPSVFFSPADASLIAGEPAERRRFLDVTLALTSPSYLHALSRYRAALSRRNAVLRDLVRTSKGRADAEAQVAAWEPALVENGATLMRSRREWVHGVRRRFYELTQAIGERGITDVRYAPSARQGEDPTAALAAAFDEKRALDLRRGMTHAGPHRDNVVLTLGEHELRTFGSAGQQRTASIALRILEAETYREATGASPVFLMDDPFAELDAGRTNRILDLLQHLGLGQTLLAVPRTSDIPDGFRALPRAQVVSGRLTFDRHQ